MNQFNVGAVGKKIQIHNIAQRPTLTPKEALELAAWLVATAAPLLAGDAGEVLKKFHKMVGDAAEGTDLEVAAQRVVEELE